VSLPSRERLSLPRRTDPKHAGSCPKQDFGARPRGSCRVH
jgi:hypothetical protein